MPYSMTGWGTCRTREYTINIRGLNSKYREVSLHAPQELFAMEPRIHRYFSGIIKRGRVDVYVGIDRSAFRKKVKINEEFFSEVYGKLSKLALKAGKEKPSIGLALNSVEGIIEVQDADPGMFSWKKLETAVSRAARDFMAMKKKEGRRLAADISKRASIIRAETAKIKKRYPVYKKNYIKKTGEKAYALLDKQGRGSSLNRELVEILDRMDINEELVRLFSHIKQLGQAVKNKEGCGRKTDFIGQEIYREANTIASKTQDDVITKSVIIIKENTEKIREQAMNLE